MAPGRGRDRSPSRVSRRRFLAAGPVGIATPSGCIVHGEDSGLEGEITVDGSGTVLPHSAALAEEFQWRNNRVRIPVRGLGTGAGFQRFCADETDLQNASREIVDDEVRNCDEGGVEYVELGSPLDGPETAPVLVIAATSMFTPPYSLLGPFSVMPVQTFEWEMHPGEEFQHVAVAGSNVLLTVLLLMNAVAILVRNRYDPR